MSKKEKEFEVVYTLDDGYAGGSQRIQSVDIKAHEIGAEATETGLRIFLEEAVVTHMMDHIFPMVKNSGEFIAWAKAIQKEKADE